MDLTKIQQAIQSEQLDGWLFCNFHNRDHLAIKILGLDPQKFSTRRWFYFIPVSGAPLKLVSKVEETVLNALPGQKSTFLSWQSMHEGIKSILGDHKKIAVNYSPMNHIPYTSMVDAGTVELLKSFGYELISAANLIQQFEAALDDAAYQSHIEAGKTVLQIKDEAFSEIGKAIQTGKEVTEYEIQQYIMRRFEEEGLTCEDHGPIVGVNEHPADPHFEPTPENSHIFKSGDTVLIDLWAKQNKPGAIYYDITWCGYIGDTPPAKYVEIFNTVRDARKAAKAFVEERFSKGRPCYGWEVDDACRNVVKSAGYNDYFLHRTGHSIGTNIHGNGVHIDNLETRDERRLIPGICFSIEPGIYLAGEMGVRSEINVFITPAGKVVIYGDEQESLILI